MASGTREKNQLKNKDHSVAGSSRKKTTENMSHLLTSFQEKQPSSFHQMSLDAELDILYAQYLQMAYLESEAKQTLLERSSYVMDIFRKLSSLIMKYSVKVNSQKFSLQARSVLTTVYEHIQKQEVIFKPLIEVVPTLQMKYGNLAEAVSIVKNKLYVKDIEVPQSDHEGDVIESLNQMQAFIVELFEQDLQYRRIGLVSDSYKNYVDSCETIKEVLKRGLDLLILARPLFFTAASLALSTTD